MRGHRHVPAKMEDENMLKAQEVRKGYRIDTFHWYKVS